MEVQKIIVGLFKKPLLFAIVVFISAFIVRISYIIFEPLWEGHFIDLGIYIDGGQLITNGVNPYDYEDGRNVRSVLRTDSTAYSSYVSETQERWDYYASGNLPFSLLFYGAIDFFSTGNMNWYRFVFASMDALLSALIVLFCVQFWQLAPSFWNLLLIFGLGAFSPTFLLWGTLIPEDKGVQTLLMLLAIYCAKTQRWIISSLLLGASVAFKGLGVFISPLCLYYVLGGTLHNIKRTNISKGGIYIFLSLLACGITFLPYVPEVFDMMQHRMAADTSSIEPIHSSMWRIFYFLSPYFWVWIKNTFAIIFSILFIHYYLIKKFNMTALCIFSLVLFVDILLLAGDLSRMNIGIMTAVILFGIFDPVTAKKLGWFSIIVGGFISFVTGFFRLGEILGALYVLLFVTLLTIHLIQQSFGTRDLGKMPL